MVRVLLIWLTLILMAGQAQAAGLEFLAEDEDLSQGTWVLLIHGADCSYCRQYCAPLEAELSKLRASASATSSGVKVPLKAVGVSVPSNA